MGSQFFSYLFWALCFFAATKAFVVDDMKTMPISSSRTRTTSVQQDISPKGLTSHVSKVSIISQNVLESTTVTTGNSNGTVDHVTDISNTPSSPQLQQKSSTVDQNLDRNVSDSHYQELLTIIQDEKASRESLVKKHESLEEIVKQLQNELTQRNTTEMTLNETVQVVNCSCRTDYEELENKFASLSKKMDMASNNLLPIFNEIASLKQSLDKEHETWMNETDQLSAKLQESEAKLNELRSKHENISKDVKISLKEIFFVNETMHELNSSLLVLLSNHDNLENKVDVVVGESKLRDKKISDLRKNMSENHEQLVLKVNELNNNAIGKLSKATQLIKFYNILNNEEIKHLREDLNIFEVSTNISYFNITEKIKNSEMQFEKGLTNLKDEHNKSISEVLKSIKSLKVDVNNTESEFKREMQQITESCFRNISTTGKELEVKILSITGDLVDLRNDSHIFADQIQKNMEKFTKNCAKNLSTIEVEIADKIDKLEEKHNESAQAFKTDLNYLEEKLNQTERKISLNMDIFSEKCWQNISETTAEFQKELYQLAVWHNKSINEVLIDIEDKMIKDNHQILENINLTFLSMNAKIENEIQAERQNNTNNTIRLDQLETNLKIFKQNVTEARQVSIVTNKNIIAIQANLNNKFLTLEKEQNITRKSFSNKLDELQNILHGLDVNMSRNSNYISSVCVQNISDLQQSLDNTFKTLHDIQNSSIGRLRKFEENIRNRDLAFNNSLKQLSTSNLLGIARLESEQRDSIKRLETMHNRTVRNLTNSVGSFDQKVASLDVNLVTLARQIASMNKNISIVDTRLRSEISKIVASHSQNIDSFLNGIGTLTKKFNSLKVNLSRVMHEKDTTSQSVAMTTCSDAAKSYNGGSLIPFRNIRTTYGINNLADFNKTRTFSCEIAGLYLVTAQVMSYSKGAEYRIMKNNLELIRVEVTPYHDTEIHNYHTGTGIAVVELAISDTISVQVLDRVTEMYIFGTESCLTIARLN